MEEPFDIRIEKDRISLSRFLPEFDGRIFNFAKSDFIAGLASAALYLGNPDWMVYRWGCFVIPTGYKTKLIFSLDQLITLGLQLQRLSHFENFADLISGFHNPSQFEDTRFEVQVADYFAQLDWVRTIKFSPEQKARGRVKRPDLKITGISSTLYVECKRCHLHIQQALISLNSISNRFKKVMDEYNWSSDLRLEVELIRPLYGNVDDFIRTTVQTGLVMGAATTSIDIGPFRSYVVLRLDAFRLPQANWITDTMVIGNEPTGVLNPKFTMLRVANYRAYARCQKSVGLRVNQALRQLPEKDKCMIFIGDVPVYIGQSVCGKRMRDSIYDNVIAFGIWEMEAVEPILFCRAKDSDHVGLIFNKAISMLPK